jgi:choline monooxygenase
MALSAAALAAQPLDRARALPAAAFVDGEIAAAERAAVFARGWQWIAHASQLAAAGDHVVSEIGGVPLLLVRGADGVLRALHNVCRHRAGPLAVCDGRAARALHCRYHGWTYELDGRLRGAPEMSGASDFDVTAIRLPQAQLAEWQGLIFAALEPAMPLATIVEGIDARLAQAGLGTQAVSAQAFDAFEHAGRVTYDIGCNWKVYVDNYLEGYHVPHVHPELNRMLDYRSYRTETAAWQVLQSSPIRSDAGGEALYYWLWPNTMLNILPDRLQTNRVLPLAVDRCRVVFDFFYAPQVPESARVADRAFSDEVQREDVGICEAVQRGVTSGSYEPGRLNPLRETGVFHFHELWRAALRA